VREGVLGIGAHQGVAFIPCFWEGYQVKSITLKVLDSPVSLCDVQQSSNCNCERKVIVYSETMNFCARSKLKSMEIIECDVPVKQHLPA
jgi:hypothetical protein